MRILCSVVLYLKYFLRFKAVHRPLDLKTNVWINKNSLQRTLKVVNVSISIIYLKNFTRLPIVKKKKRNKLKNKFLSYTVRKTRP